MENKEINLVEILKDHIGIKLYSPALGEVTLKEVGIYDESYPIKVTFYVKSYKREKQLSRQDEELTSTGKLWLGTDSECMLFPSKENRDWSTFITGLKVDTPCIVWNTYRINKILRRIKFLLGQWKKVKSLII